MEQLLSAISMPEEVCQAILRLHRDPGFQPDLSGLTCMDRWEEGRRALKAALGPDPEGFRELCCQLRCALAAKAEFDRLGISGEVYFHTMACFSRFVREHRESYGCYGFDRGFWTVRQISSRLFRIGQLEYELTVREGQKGVSLHIPTDVILRPELLRTSYLSARALLEAHFPDYARGPWYCHSWLLTPDLHRLLPESSNILRFQQSFSITPLESPSTGVLQWVFKNPGLPPEQFPENTTLQRNLKAFLLSGHTFHDARGTLISDPFR